MNQGIVYYAQGKDYVREALVSATSSLRHNRVPHILFSDALSQGLDGLECRVFETCGNPYADKIDAMIRSPFKETLYIDTDTWITADITELFKLLTRFDMAVARAPGTMGVPDPEVPNCFFEFNTGVIAYRGTSKVRQFLERWRQTYQEWVKLPPFPGAGYQAGSADQPAFRRCAWQSDLALHVLPPEYNYRTCFPGFLVGPAKVIHGRASDYEALAASLNKVIAPRSIPQVTRR